MSLIVSPKTGRLIKVGGKTFSDLLKDPQYQDLLLNPETSNISKGKVEVSGSPLSSPPMSPIYSPSSPSISLSGIPMPVIPLKPISLKQNSNDHLSDILSMSFLDIPTLEETLKTTKQPAKKAKIAEMIENKRYEEGRGIKTRGWSSRSPTRGQERHQLKSECGNKCFLLPGKEKFPICASPRTTGGKSKCEIDCGGVQSALIRAKQWGYEDVAEKAEKILEKCNLKGLDRFLPTPPTSPLPSTSIQSPKILPSLKMGGKMDDKILVPPSLNRYDKINTSDCGCGK